MWYAFIHPSIIFCLSRIVLWWQQVKQGIPDISLLSNTFQFLQGDSKARWNTKSLQQVLGLPLGLLPFGCAQNTSMERHSGGVLIRCQNYLSWLPLTQRTSGSTPSSLQKPGTPSGAHRWELGGQDLIHWTQPGKAGRNDMESPHSDFITCGKKHWCQVHYKTGGWQWQWARCADSWHQSLVLNMWNSPSMFVPWSAQNSLFSLTENVHLVLFWQKSHQPAQSRSSQTGSQT